MLKYLLFDIDDTLLDFQKSKLFALIKTFKDHNIILNNEMIADYERINDYFWGKFESKELSKDEILNLRFKVFTQRYNLDLDYTKLNIEFLTNLANHPFLMDNTLEVLNDLKDEYQIYLVTNGVEFVQESRLHITGIDKLVKGVFVSEKVGYNKPDPKYFEYVFNHIEGFKKEEALLIGDSLTSDIQGANNVGLRCCYFKHNDKDYKAYNIDFIIDDITQIYDVIDNF